MRNGKGIAGIHAATDSYHSDCTATGGGGGSSTPLTVAALLVTQGDANGDKKLTRKELTTLADTWFDKLDPDKTGKVSQADFATRFASIMPAPAGGGFGGGFGGRGASGRGAGRAGGGEPTPILQWPEFNKLIGGYFKFHWSDPSCVSAPRPAESGRDELRLVAPLPAVHSLPDSQYSVPDQKNGGDPDMTGPPPFFVLLPL